MTGVRTFVTFETYLPDDSIFSDDGNIIAPGGRNVCLKLIEIFSLRGNQVTTPQQHEFYGWEFTAKLSSDDTWMLLQGGHPWLLIIKDKSEKKRIFGKPSESQFKILNLIDDVMKSCEAFGNISWFTRHEYEAGAQAGSPLP